MTTVEYVLVIALLAIVGFPAWRSLGEAIADKTAAAEEGIGALPGAGASSAEPGDDRWGDTKEVASGAAAAAKRFAADYSVVFRNCEHFAEWCVHGKAKSRQSALGIGAAVGAGAVGGAFVGREVAGRLAAPSPNHP